MNASHQQSSSIVLSLENVIESKSSSLGGNVPGIASWEFVGNPIGHTNGTKEILAQDSFIDIEVEPENGIGNIQANYISVTNGGVDAICVSGFTVTFPDGAKAGFSANTVAGKCDAQWSMAFNSVIQATGLNTGEPLAKCIWIDRNKSNDLRFQGFALHLPSFTTQTQGLAVGYQKDNHDLMRKSGPRFRMYEELVTTSPIFRYDPPLVFLTNRDTNDTNKIGADADESIIINNPGLSTGFFKTKRYTTDVQ